MPKLLELGIGILAIVTTLVGGTVTIENRYAKAEETKQSIQSIWVNTLKLRILELELKPADQFSTNDRALLDHLKRELNEAENRR